MRKIVFVVSIIAALALSLVSCKPKGESSTQDNQVMAIDDAHNSRNSVNWDGLYTGTVPCADCSGIKVQITLNLDETYQISYQYLEKDDSIYSASGKFIWDDAGDMITLDSRDFPPHYKVGENRLIQLDMEGNPITGEHAEMYELTKSDE
jgi:uncharacterized lipoprotein NlpE involved in copper resistance